MRRRMLNLIRRNWVPVTMGLTFFVLVPLVGVPIASKIEARRTLEAANAGDLAMQVQAGNIYTDGSGVEIDYQQAARWWKVAAERGHLVAQMNLAEAYLRGRGVQRDAEAAIGWYLTAANHGWAPAMMKLSQIYERGASEIAADIVESYRWAWLVFAAGQMKLQDQVQHEAVIRPKSDSEALWRITSNVFNQMTEEQKEEAMNRARAWKPVPLKFEY